MGERFTGLFNFCTEALCMGFFCSGHLIVPLPEVTKLCTELNTKTEHCTCLPGVPAYQPFVNRTSGPLDPFASQSFVFR